MECTSTLEEIGRARQLADKLGQTDRHDNAFVYEPATMRCKEMSKKKKKKVQVGVSTIPILYGLLCAGVSESRPLMHRAAECSLLFCFDLS